MEGLDGEPASPRAWATRITAAVRSKNATAIAAAVKVAALGSAIAGRLDLIERWLRFVPKAQIEGDPQLLYWSGMSILLQRPADALPLLGRAFDALKDGSDSRWALLAWAGCADAIFLSYRDLRELDPLLAWMSPEREHFAEGLVRPERALIVASALFALAFRQPHHPRLDAWRERAERLIESDPTSDLGARLTAGLIIHYTWRGNLAAAEIAAKRFRARATRVKLSPLSRMMGHVNEATLSLHQGKLAECIRVVEEGLAESPRHGVRLFDGVMHCHAAAASCSRGDADAADRHLAAVEALFAEGIPIDEAYYRAMLLWSAFVAGDHIGAVSRSAVALEVTNTKGVPYLEAVCRIASALTLFEAGHRERGKALLADGQCIGREIANPLLLWIAGLFESHMAYAAGDAASGDALLGAALALGRDHSLAHFFCWPRGIMVRLIDRALGLDLFPDYLAQLIARHEMTPGSIPTRSDRWAFAVRIYTFGTPRVVHADGRIEPLSPQLKRQVNLLATLIGKQGKPTPLHAIASDLYAGEDVDATNSAKHALHMLRARIGPVVTQRDGALAIDFSQVWIDACSFQELRRETANAAELEAWLDRHYHGHFLDRVEGSSVALRLRVLFAESAERAIRDLQMRSAKPGEEDALRRLESRWQHLFPGAFAPLRR